MDPNAVKLALISVLLFVGALNPLPPILKSLFDVIKEVLELVGEFVHWFYDWRRRTWPDQAKPRSVDKPA